MNIYLDIDGVLLLKGSPALGVANFLKYITSNHNCFWLTTHCQGDVQTAIDYLNGKISAAALEYVKNIKPTHFNTWKTEAIDFSKDFRWVDDYVFETELKELTLHGCTEKLILINLQKTPNQLMELNI